MSIESPTIRSTEVTNSGIFGDNQSWGVVSQPTSTPVNPMGSGWLQPPVLDTPGILVDSNGGNPNNVDMVLPGQEHNMGEEYYILLQDTRNNTPRSNESAANAQTSTVNIGVLAAVVVGILLFWK